MACSDVDKLSSRPLENPLQWYAMKIRTGGELRVAEGLSSRGYEIFVPTSVESRRYSDRIKVIKAPLFPGYAFCRLDIERRLPILQSFGVDHFVGIGRVPVPIPDAEILALHKVVASALPAQPWPYLAAGDQIHIQYGALTGLTGLLVSIKGAERLVLSVHLLQRSISVEIDRSWVRPALVKSNID